VPVRLGARALTAGEARDDASFLTTLGGTSQLSAPPAEADQPQSDPSRFAQHASQALMNNANIE
jgi:hypothetical protein